MATAITYHLPAKKPAERNLTPIVNLELANISKPHTIHMIVPPRYSPNIKFRSAADFCSVMWPQTDAALQYNPEEGTQFLWNCKRKVKTQRSCDMCLL
jgi:hypothetical protein